MIALLLTLLACQTSSPCEDLCTELVMSCGYAAYPTRESCLQGCGYDEANGADIEKRLECVTAAECDTFEVIECEHARGPAESDAR